MQKHGGRRLLEVIAAAAVAALSWSVAHRHYEELLARTIKLAAPSTELATDGSALLVRRPEGTEALTVAPLALLSFQFVFFAAIAPLMARQRTRVWLRVMIAVLALFLTHLAALRLGVSAVLATSFGEWSERHYSDFAANVLFYLWQGYLVVGGYAIVFAAAWLTFASTERRERGSR